MTKKHGRKAAGPVGLAIAAQSANPPGASTPAVATQQKAATTPLPEASPPAVATQQKAATTPLPEVSPPAVPTQQEAATPAMIYVLSDSEGFVGAYTSESELAATVEKYNTIPLVLQKFALAPGQAEQVWVVIYRDINAVAFVSNSREKAQEIKRIYESVGLTYIDSIDYWEQPINQINKIAKDRLDAIKNAHNMYTPPETIKQRAEEDLARIQILSMPSADGPIARLLAENKRISILEDVVECAPATTEAALAAAAPAPVAAASVVAPAASVDAPAAAKIDPPIEEEYDMPTLEDATQV